MRQAHPTPGLSVLRHSKSLRSCAGVCWQREPQTTSLDALTTSASGCPAHGRYPAVHQAPWGSTPYLLSAALPDGASPPLSTHPGPSPPQQTSPCRAPSRTRHDVASYAPAKQSVLDNTAWHVSGNSFLYSELLPDPCPPCPRISSPRVLAVAEPPRHASTTIATSNNGASHEHGRAPPRRRSWRRGCSGLGSLAVHHEPSCLPFAQHDRCRLRLADRLGWCSGEG